MTRLCNEPGCDQPARERSVPWGPRPTKCTAHEHHSNRRRRRRRQAGEPPEVELSKDVTNDFARCQAAPGGGSVSAIRYSQVEAAAAMRAAEEARVLARRQDDAAAMRAAVAQQVEAELYAAAAAGDQVAACALEARERERAR